MKKRIVLISITIVVLAISVGVVLYLCRYAGWKQVNIKNVGSFLIPEEWYFTEADSRYYISDRPLEEEGCIIYLEQFVDYTGIKSEPAKLYSNSSLYGMCYQEISPDERSWFLVFCGPEYCRFSVIDETITEKMIQKICKSYRLAG